MRKLTLELSEEDGPDGTLPIGNSPCVIVVNRKMSEEERTKWIEVAGQAIVFIKSEMGWEFSA